MSLTFDPGALRLAPCHLVAGARLERGGDDIPVLRPSDHVQVGVVRDAGEEIVQEAVRQAVAAAPAWTATHPVERAAVLHRWARLLEERAPSMAQLEAGTSTRPIAEVAVRDVARAAGAIRYFAEWADKIEGSVVATGPDATCLVLPEPYGVVGAITAWNFPLINAVWKMAPALAAGNAVVLKPSELTPFSAVALAELGLEAGLPAGLLNIVQGAGPSTGSALVRHPLVRKVTFTGSAATGMRIMADAALSGTKPVTLELGGKSPQLVLEDVADLEPVALAVANGFLANAGQVCTAGSRLIVSAARADELIERVVEHARAKVPGPTWAESTTLPPLVSQKQMDRIEGMLAETLRDGAQIVTGGRRVPGQNAGAYLEPTILRGVREDSVGFREEFFGPVLSVHTYGHEDEGIAMANHPRYALAASLYTDDVRKAQSVPKRLDAGTVWVNTHGRQFGFGHPQGGFNGSGFGKEMGRAGVESFLRYKTLWNQHG